MIKIENISKKFDSFTALDQLNLHVKKGEFYSLLGPNGAGKTTCINIISNITKATQGSVEIDGLNTSKHSLKVKKRIGIVPQEIALYEDLTAGENLKFWGKINGVDSSKLNKKIDEVLGFLDLLDQKDKLISSYSGGMKRRINIAAALLHDPEVLFMDEPTVGIDPQSRLFTYEIFEKLHQQGKTIFYTSHNMEEVERLSDRIGIIDHGKLIAEGSLEELKRQLSMEETLVVSFKKKTAISSEQIKRIIAEKTPFFEMDNDQLFVSTKNATHDLVGILQILDKHKIEVLSAEVKKVNLEMIFLELTGKKLRE
ncbi:MAG: ATP-binding cassette domain-containing protein [Bacteroidales bacterium]|nr:ATP-binding cassette domain-containing protein [Bacteroidales bacterium]